MRDASSNPLLDGDLRITTVRESSETAVLALEGDADLHTAPQLRECIRDVIDGGVTTLVLDLSEATFVDSTTLGVFLGGMKRLREHNGRILLVVPRADVRRVFEMTLLDRIFPLYDTRAEALAGSNEPS